MRAGLIFEIILPVLLVGWAFILTYSAVASDTGFRASAALNSEIDAKIESLGELRERRLALERRADQLNSRSLDPDLADEKIRLILGYSRDGEVIVPRAELEKALRDRD